MADCGLIEIGSEVDCENIPRGGTRPRAIAFNYDQVTGHTEDANQKVTALTLAAGAQGYVFTGFRNDVKKSDEVINPGVGLNQFKHNVGWVIYERTQEQKNNVEKLAKGRFIVIIENKGKDDDAVEVVGLGVGVEIVAGPVRNAHENGGFFILNFATAEGEHEEKLPQTLGTSYSNAQTLLDTYAPAESGS